MREGGVFLTPLPHVFIAFNGLSISDILIKSDRIKHEINIK
jgi:hypothetical protein